jgi:hypothetical protein
MFRQRFNQRRRRLVVLGGCHWEQACSDIADSTQRMGRLGPSARDGRAFSTSETSVRWRGRRSRSGPSPWPWSVDSFLSCKTKETL